MMNQKRFHTNHIDGDDQNQLTDYHNDILDFIFVNLKVIYRFQLHTEF